MRASGQIEFLEGDQAFALVCEPGGWRMSMDWAEAILVRLTAEVGPDLPWDFYPLQPEVRALPGETLSVTYRAENQFNRAITTRGKQLSCQRSMKNTSPPCNVSASSSRP